MLQTIAIQQLFCRDGLKHRECRATHQRVAAERGAMIAGLQDLGGLASGETGADGQAIAETLRERHDIRLYVRMLEGKPAAGSSHAGLYLIEHQQPVAAVDAR